MTTPISWTLLSPPPASAGSGGPATGNAPPLPCPIAPFTQQDLLDLIDRLLPPHYLEPIKSPGPGYELFQAMTAMMARCSVALERLGCGALILSATGGLQATGQVELYRASVNSEGITVVVKAGTLLRSSRGGRKYETTADVVFGPNDLGPFVVPIKAVAVGYEYNEPGIVVTLDGTSLPGEIDTIDTLVESAPSQPLGNAGTATVTFNAPTGGIQLVSGMLGGLFSLDSVGHFVTFTGALNAANNGNRLIVEYVSATSVKVQNLAGVLEVSTPNVSWQEFTADSDVGDITIQVRHPSATSGGRDAFLDQQGSDRGILRGEGEEDDPYRGRIRSLPDNISPDAVDRSLQQLLLPFGQSYQFIETWDIAYQTCWDGPADPIAGSNYDPNLFCYDDPRPVVPFRNRWLDVSEMRGAFIIVVPNFGPLKDVGMAYDDISTDAASLTNANGLRAVSAWDVPATLGFGYLQGSYDGYDLVRATTMKTVYETLQRIKAAGTAAVLELQGE